LTKAGFSRVKPVKPALDEKEIYGVLPKARKWAIRHDGNHQPSCWQFEFEAYKDGYGQTI
jgi:hypothetical protein